jgi:FSR family fosmidomycin resistance protein-like MFS transporter
MHKLGLGALLLAHTTVDMQTSSLTVFLPLLLASFNLNYASAAAILSVNNLIIAIAQPLFGLFGDRRQVRWLVTAGCALCGAAMASVLFLPNYWLVLAAVLLSGLGSAAFHPEALSNVRGVSGSQKETGSSIFFFGGNLGFAFGPIVAALLIEHLGVAGVIGMILPTLIGCACLWTQHRRYVRPVVSPQSERAHPATSRFQTKTVGLVTFLLSLSILRSIVLSGLLAFIPLYFTTEGTMTKPEIARLLTILAAMGTLGTLFGGPLAERVGRRVVMAGAMAMVLPALFVFLRSTGLMQMVALGIAGAAITAPWTLTVVMVQDAMPNNLGLAAGLTLGTAYGANGLGVAALGWLADVAGLPQTMLVITLLPIVILVMSLFVPEKRQGLREAAST